MYSQYYGILLSFIFPVLTQLFLWKLHSYFWVLTRYLWSIRFIPHSFWDICEESEFFSHTFMSTDMPIFVLDLEQSSSSIYKKNLTIFGKNPNGGGRDRSRDLSDHPIWRRLCYWLSYEACWNLRGQIETKNYKYYVYTILGMDN